MPPLLPILLLAMYALQPRQLTITIFVLTNPENQLIPIILIKETEQPAMKNNIQLMLIGFMLLSVLPSCKKTIQTCKLGKYYLSDGSSTPAPNTFSYYEDGRVKSIAYTDGSKDNVTYSADTIKVLTFDNRDSLIANFSGVVNASGYVTAGTKTTYDYIGNATGTQNLAFEYNADGNMTKQTTNNALGTSILSLSYTGGNSTTAVLYNGVTLNKKYFFYHNTIANKTKVDDLNGVLAPWYGKPSNNLLDSTHIIIAATSDTVRIQYAHTLNENDYLSNTTQTWLTPGVQTKFHTYQYFDCK